jgi:hypothetical protein
MVKGGGRVRLMLCLRQKFMTFRVKRAEALFNKGNRMIGASLYSPPPSKVTNPFYKCNASLAGTRDIDSE